jgi:hypothetical protein
MKKIFIFLILFPGFLFLAKNDVLSQYTNYYTCTTTVGLGCTLVNHCQPGQVPYLDWCNGLSDADCLARAVARPCECYTPPPQSGCNPAPEATATPVPGTTPPSGPDPGIHEGCEADEINTAIGCISFGSMTSLSSFLLRWGIGIAGGIAFVLSVAAGFMISTSAGNPKRLQAGKELLTSALSGLLFLIFSVFLLRLIGVDILN